MRDIRPLLCRLLEITKAVLLGYAVVFALVGTLAFVWAAVTIYRPISAVRALASTNPVETTYMTQVREELRAAGEPDSLVHSFIPLDTISDALVQAVLAAEDDGFYTHPGFDINAILAAAEYNRSHNRIKHGGSTITQQVAKNLFLSTQRSFKRKARELVYAILLETYLSKDRILELYLNYAQWGERIFGCEAAARHYFGKPCAKLGRYESARLAATLSKPTKMNPRTSTSGYMGKRLKAIANNLYQRKRIDESAFERISGEPPPGADSAVDTTAPTSLDTSETSHVGGADSTTVHAAANSDSR